MKSFKEYTEAFDAAKFRRHMDSLRAKEELKKTDPVAAKAHELAGKQKEKMTSTKKNSGSGAAASHNSDPYSSWNSVHSPNWKP